MARWLKQSTSVDVPIGPFLDSTDGVTAETALTITQPDIRLKKNAAAWAQKNAAQTLSHEENGYYEVTLDATDTDTLGLLRLAVAESGAMPVWEDFLVVPANVWDSYFSTDLLQVDVQSWTDVNLLTGAGALPGLGVTRIGTLQAVTDADTVRIDASASFADNELNGQTFHAISSTGGSPAGAGQSAVILSNALTNDVVNFAAALATTLAGTTIRYAIYGSPPAGIDSRLDTLDDLAGMIESGPRLTAAALALAPTGGTDYTVTGTADSGSTTSMIDNERTEATGYFDSWKLRFTSGPTGQERTVRAYTNSGGTKTFTWDRALTAAITTNTYELRPQGDAMLSPGTHTSARIPNVTLVDTLTTYTGNTPQTGDAFARLGAPAGASVSADVAAVKAQTAAIEVDTQDIQTKVGTPAGASVSADVAAVKAQTAAIETDTQDIQSKVGTPAGASVSADVAAVKSQTAAIETDTQDIQGRLPAALNNGCIPADVQRINNEEVLGTGTSGNKWRGS